MPFGSIRLNDGNSMPTIAYGTGSKWKRQSIVEYVKLAIETGFSHIDAAEYYETEEDVGIAIKQSGLARSDIFVTSKYSFGIILDSCKGSLERLGLKQLDLYLVHFPFRIEPDVSGGWRQFEEIKELGLAKSIGVSNFYLEDFKKLMKEVKIVPAVNQIPFHPYNYTELKPVLEYCAKHGITVEAYSPLVPITTYPGGPLDKPLSSIAKARGITPVQVLFLWVKAKGVVIVTTSSTRARLQEYLAVGDLPPLTDAEIIAIEEAGAKGPPKMTFQMALQRVDDKRITVLVLLLFVELLLIFSYGPVRLW